jgi:hypothetical protein
MKKRLTGIIMIIGIFAATAVISNAQITRQLRTKVPFSFTIGKTELPAGNYVITFGAATKDNGTIIVRSEDGSRSVIEMVQSEVVERANETTGVTFERVNGKYYLGSVSIYALKVDLDGPKSDAPGLKLAAK